MPSSKHRHKRRKLARVFQPSNQERNNGKEYYILENGDGDDDHDNDAQKEEDQEDKGEEERSASLNHNNQATGKENLRVEDTLLDDNKQDNTAQEEEEQLHGSEGKDERSDTENLSPNTSLNLNRKRSALEYDGDKQEEEKNAEQEEEANVNHSSGHGEETVSKERNHGKQLVDGGDNTAQKKEERRDYELKKSSSIVTPESSQNRKNNNKMNAAGGGENLRMEGDTIVVDGNKEDSSNVHEEEELRESRDIENLLSPTSTNHNNGNAFGDAQEVEAKDNHVAEEENLHMDEEELEEEAKDDPSSSCNKEAKEEDLKDNKIVCHDREDLPPTKSEKNHHNNTGDEILRLDDKANDDNSSCHDQETMAAAAVAAANNATRDEQEEEEAKDVDSSCPDQETMAMAAAAVAAANNVAKEDEEDEAEEATDDDSSCHDQETMAMAAAAVAAAARATSSLTAVIQLEDDSTSDMENVPPTTADKNRHNSDTAGEENLQILDDDDDDDDDGSDSDCSMEQDTKDQGKRMENVTPKTAKDHIHNSGEAEEEENLLLDENLDEGGRCVKQSHEDRAYRRNRPRRCKSEATHSYLEESEEEDDGIRDDESIFLSSEDEDNDDQSLFSSGSSCRHSDTSQETQQRRDNKRRRTTEKSRTSNNDDTAKNNEMPSVSVRMSQPGTIDRVPIEQIDPTTLEVIGVYSSKRKAEEKTGVNRRTIARVLAKQGKPLSGEFFWRFQGTTDSPWEAEAPAPHNRRPVEKLCLKTGDVLEEFQSLRAATDSTGTKARDTIRKVCNAKRKSAYGFFWRWKGSQGKGRKPVEQVDVETGQVKTYFESVKEASEAGYCGSNIIGVLKGGRMSANGFFWRYKGSDKLPLKRKVRKPVQQLCLETRAVIATYTSIVEAAAALRVENSSIGKCCNDRKGNFSAGGFGWRFEGSKPQPGRRKPVQQLCLDTGAIIATFASMTEAAVANGIDSGSIGKCCNGCMGVLSAGGFGWRFQGSDRLPSKPKLTLCKPVQQLCLETGAVIATFVSMTEAAEATGIDKGSIGRCCNESKGSFSAGGFGWRFEGSDRLPSKPKWALCKPVQQLCLDTGAVIATHNSATEAAEAFGIDNSGISDCCHGRRGSAGGYGWCFAPTDN